MANSNVKLITTEDGYKLVVGGEESEVMDYGEPLEFNGYLAFVDLPEGSDEAEDVECRLENWVYKVQPVSDVEPEEEDEDTEDDEDDEEEEGDGGEGADVVVEAAAYGDDEEDEDDDEDEGIV
jgi:hypothetical protein